LKPEPHPFLSVAGVTQNYAAPQFKLPEYRIIRHPVIPVPDWKKLTMPEPVRYRIKTAAVRHFLARYRTEMTDAGMPMPALVFKMPMPTYDFQYKICE
jgi:hypothetical protein